MIGKLVGKAKEYLFKLFFSKKLIDAISKASGPLNDYKSLIFLVLLAAQQVVVSGACGEYCIFLSEVISAVLSGMGMSVVDLQGYTVAALVASLWHSLGKWINKLRFPDAPERPTIVEVNR